MRKNVGQRTKPAKPAKPAVVSSGSDDSAISESASRKIGDFLKRKRASAIRGSAGIEPAIDGAGRHDGAGTGGATAEPAIDGAKSSVASGDSGKRAGAGAGKQRGARVSGTGTGAGTGTGTRTGTGTAAGSPQAEVGENPVRGVVPGIKIGKQKKTKAEERADAKFQASVMAGLLETLFVGLFASIAITTRQDHWQLTKQESSALSSQLNAALETLPPGSYEQIRKLTDKYVPWLGLVITAAAVVGPKIEASRINRKAKTVENSGTASGGADGEWRGGFANPYRHGDGADSKRNSVPH